MKTQTTPSTSMRTWATASGSSASGANRNAVAGGYTNLSKCETPCAVATGYGERPSRTARAATLKMPKSCPGVDDPTILNPRNTWADQAAYDAQAIKLRDMFRQNFKSKGFAAFGIEERI